MKSIGLKLSQNDLYPPLLSVQPSDVAIAALLPSELRFTLNGNSGDVPGITVTMGSRDGTITFTQEFIAQYSASWPARFEVQAYMAGEQVDSATLLLHDTRSMVVSHAEARISLNPVNVPIEEDLLVPLLPLFFDANGVPLPLTELVWDTLLQPADGVTMDDDRIRISPDAPVGTVKVSVREQSGVKGETDLVLLDKNGIGLSLEPADFYPPLISEEYETIRCITEGGWEGSRMTWSLNGRDGPFAGFTAFETSFQILPTFIHNYRGSWPIELKVEAVRAGQVIGIATGWLHDTREMVVDKVDIVVTPGEDIEIPKEGEANRHVFASPRFYDKDGIRLPSDELVWDGYMVDEMVGVVRHKHVFVVTPKAEAGLYLVGIRAQIDMNQPGPDDPKREVVLNLR